MRLVSGTSLGDSRCLGNPLTFPTDPSDVHYLIRLLLGLKPMQNITFLTKTSNKKSVFFYLYNVGNNNNNTFYLERALHLGKKIPECNTTKLRRETQG